MKDRTVLASAVIAAVIHAIILFANLGMTPPTLASAASSIEVTLVAAPAVPAAQASAKPTVAPTPKPEPIIDLACVHKDLVAVEEEIRTATKKYNEFLAELGLPRLPESNDKGSSEEKK